LFDQLKKIKNKNLFIVEKSLKILLKFFGLILILSMEAKDDFIETRKRFKRVCTLYINKMPLLEMFLFPFVENVI
jgi:hypothetical protein